MNPVSLRRTLAITATGLLLCSPTAQAGRPMTTDDADTLGQGGVELQAGWQRDDGNVAMGAAVGYGLIDTLDIELEFERGDDDASGSVRALALALKWVPIRSNAGSAVGLGMAYGHARIDASDGKTHENSGALTALFSHPIAEEALLHVNLGREWSDDDEGTTAGNLWGVGIELPLVGPLTLTVETFGVSEARPDRAAGIRFELADGVELSAAVGRGNDRSFASAGIVYEF